jgi:predicted lipoprotein with Yx(FWY)xxD motif
MRTIFLGPLLLGALIAAGCGSSSSTSSSATSTSTAAAQATTSASGAYGSRPAATSAGATAVTVTTKSSKLGTILAAGPKRLTVYMFEADKGSSSSCSGPCAQVWPPVTGKASATGKAPAGNLGTLTRADGTTQVTYKGHPLYYFAKDKDDGDAYGEGIKGFGASWYVLQPSGAKVDKS